MHIWTWSVFRGKYEKETPQFVWYSPQERLKKLVFHRFSSLNIISYNKVFLHQILLETRKFVLVIVQNDKMQILCGTTLLYGIQKHARAYLCMFRSTVPKSYFEFLMRLCKDLSRIGCIKQRCVSQHTILVKARFMQLLSRFFRNIDVAFSQFYHEKLQWWLKGFFKVNLKQKYTYFLINRRPPVLRFR